MIEHLSQRVCQVGTGGNRVFGAMVTLKPRDEVEGSGMGLALVQKIAQLNGGQVAVLPSPFGRGSCIELRLPQNGLPPIASN